RVGRVRIIDRRAPARIDVAAIGPCTSRSRPPAFCAARAERRLAQPVRPLLALGRVRFGIALPNYGPLAAPDVLVRLAREFEALDVPFAGRGRRTEEYLAVCRALWRGGDAEFVGSCYRLPPVRTGPPPVQQPHPPLWIAGDSAAAIERAARAGDGWHAIDLAPAELAPLVARLRQRVVAHGRGPEAVTVSLRKGVLVGPDGSRPLYGDA